jgi:hypothetical protein
MSFKNQFVHQYQIVQLFSASNIFQLRRFSLYLFSQKKNGWELKPDEIAGLMLKLQNESNCHNINFGENNLKIRYYGKVLRSHCYVR